MRPILEFHVGNPNICRLKGLKIGQLPECEGGAFYLPRSQAEPLAKLFEAAFGWWDDRIPKDDKERELAAAISAFADAP